MNSVSQVSAALAGRYRIERELGGGGMSRVFLATETALGREVVIKLLAEELSTGVSAERFTREIATAARLQQANIVPVLTAGDAAGLAYYTMPFVRGESLRARLAGGTLPTMAERIGILRDIARALAYAHGEGIVHRDIKPENVLLSHGTAMVTDFGIAKAIATARTEEGVTQAATLTQAGGAVGTPAYMAPEQAIGDAVDHRTDLYAWGVLAYELLSGSHPFARHATPQQLVAAHITETPAALSPGAVPPPVASVVMRCLAKDPGQRPGSAAELLASLDLASTPVSAVPVSPARRYRPVGAALVVALVVLVISLWAMGRGGGETATGAATEQSLAVLPLANLSGDPADDYFGIGLAEEITRALAKNGVRVIGRVSAGALQARGLDERAIARELGVTSLLTGTVQRAQGQVRINVSLVSADDGAVRWTERYDRPLANVFAVQDEISRTVSDTLLGSLGRRSRPAVRTETADPEAHALFLQGMVLFNRRGARNLNQAIDLFERAAARDSAYARPHAALAMALAVLPAYVQDSTTPIATRAIAAAERAIAKDSTIAESYVALGYAHSLLDELDQAELDFQRALSFDSMSTAWGWYSLLAARRGNFKAAHEMTARALALEPASLIARVWSSQNLEQEGRYREADSASAAAIALDSTFTLAWTWRAYALLAMGRAGEAVALLERQVGLLPGNRVEDLHGSLAYAYSRAGRTADAERLLGTIRARSGGRLPPTGAIAAALEELGDHEAAVALLKAAVAQHDVWTVQFPRSERYRKLRRDPRVAALLDHLGRKQ